VSTCRTEILESIGRLARRGVQVFSPEDIVHDMAARGSTYKPSTIRTHVVSLMCFNAPRHHGTTYGDLVRVGRGRDELTEGTVRP
jgi:hypothetical protein